jgi:hypothetical protein
MELDTEDARAPAGRAPSRGPGELLERYAVVVLVVLAVVGFAMRAGGVGRVGFAEDEINKLEAVRAY